MPFVWSDQCEESFKNLSTLLTTTPILSLSVEGKDFIVFCDDSLLVLSVVLMQDRNVIVYASRQLKPHEKITQLMTWSGQRYFLHS